MGGSAKLYIVGIGPGNPDYIYPAARKLIESADVLIGGKRNLEAFRHLQKEEVAIGADLEAVETHIRRNIGKKTMVVLASGDPGLFSIATYLKERLSGIELDVYPGISALQYLCAKLKHNWEETAIVSLHGRERADWTAVLAERQRMAIFTGGDSTPDGICRELMEKGISGVTVTVGENLSYPEERIVTGPLEEIRKMRFNSLALMLLENGLASRKPGPAWKYTTTGIPDELFIRGNVPMTKEEVRALSLAKLRLEEDSVLYDIGAGTGSVSVECGLRMNQGRVYAIEQDPEALALIRQNAVKFGINNLTVVAGKAPGALLGLPEPTRIFIGGTDGAMESILDWIERVDHCLRVVINAVTIESAHEALAGFTKRGFLDLDITCVSVARGRPVGGKHLMQALNPVYIISADKQPPVGA